MNNISAKTYTDVQLKLLELLIIRTEAWQNYQSKLNAYGIGTLDTEKLIDEVEQIINRLLGEDED